MNELLRPAVAVFRRELLHAARNPAEWLQPLMFYGIVALLFPLGIAPQDPALKRFAPAIVWIGALLAALLAAEKLFRTDLDDGTLEQWWVSPAPPSLLVTAKVAAHWLLTALPLIVTAPLIGYGLGLGDGPVLALTLGLALGTPTLMLAAAFAAALTLGAPRAGMLLPILVLPLLCPAVIFGGGAVRAAEEGLSYAGPLYFLASLLVLSVTLLPLATAGALRNAIE
jgi:heme exporter protein B